jgi:hypothetical protein
MNVFRRFIIKIVQKKSKMSKSTKPVHVDGFVKSGFEKVKHGRLSNLAQIKVK